MRTQDIEYGEEYWFSYDKNELGVGAGYLDGPIWEDTAFIIHEILHTKDGKDISGEINTLDIGCAHGYLVRHLRRRGVDCWGVDYSQYAIDHSPQDINSYLKQYDLTKADIGWFFGNQSFRAFTCLETMEHIPSQYVRTALEKVYNVLKPGGRGIFTICTDKQPGWDTDPTHVTIKSKEWWQYQLTETGFYIENDSISKMEEYRMYSSHDGVFVVSKS